MKIENIEFHGFKAKHRYARVEFSSDNVTVIYGENGCGKTTFLKAINSFLSQDNDELSSIGIYKINCNVVKDGHVKSLCVDRVEDGYDWSEFEDSSLVNSKSLSLGVERGVSTQQLKVEPEVLMSFFTNSKRQLSLFDNHSHSSYSQTRRNISELSIELSDFLKRRNAARYRNRRPEINFDEKHLYLQSIKIENIEELLLQRYKVARFTATRKIQSALFDTLSVAIDVENSVSKKADTDRALLKERIIDSKDRIIEALDDGDENNFKSKIVDILGKIDQPGELDNILDHSLLNVN